MPKIIVGFISFLWPVILVASYPILFFYANNISELSLIFLKKPLLLAIFISIFITLLLNLVIRNKNKSTLITTLLIMVFFSYGHLSSFLNNKLFITIPGGLVLGPDKILLPIILVLEVFAVFKIFRTKKDLSTIINFIKIMVFLLFMYSVVIISKTELAKNRQRGNLELVKSNQDSDQGRSPDIYHIILDGYARNDVLKDIYKYDNGEFITELEKMGFYVARQARANYIHTYLSLPSTLNMEYLDFLADKYGKKPIDGSVATNMMFDNQAALKFKNMGYKTINFASDWKGTNENYPSDILYDKKMTYKILGMNIITSETNMVFLQTTLLSPLVKEVWENALRGKTLAVFEKMPDVAYLEDKKYVLAHIMSPHPPYVFTEDGGVVTNPILNNADEGVERRPYYLDQLKFISMQTLAMVKRLIENSKELPIIILQSDHGPGSSFGKREDWASNYDMEAVKERSSILYAVLLPDKDYSKFYETITPVNTYRILFNKIFGESNDLLPDKTYYTSYDEIYGFYEVTDKLDQTEKN